MIEILNFLIDRLSQFKHYLRERDLPNECKTDWVKGYRKWIKKN